MQRFPIPALAPWLLLALAALAIGAGLGLRDPSPPDEPRFVLAARQMVETGQWLVPHRGSELYADKPPLFMWLQGAAYLLAGEWRIAFLLPSLLAALGTLWLTWDLARRLWNAEVAGYAGFALLATLQFGLQAKRGQIDMVLVFLTTLSLWGLCRHLLHAPDRRALAVGGFAAGVGVVTKGVGFLPLLVLVPWALARRRAGGTTARATFAGLWPWLPGAFLAGTGIWLLPLLAALLGNRDPALAQYASEILFHQTGTRYVAAWHHVQPPWYYLQVIATLWLPGALLLPWLVPAWWRRIRAGDAATTCLVGWALLVLLFFSASPGKREVYLFPALPALCVAAAPLLPELLRRPGVRSVLSGYLVLAGLLMAGLGASGLLGAEWVSGVAAGRGLAPAELHAPLAWLAALGAGFLALALLARKTGAATAVVVGSVLLWAWYGLALAPALDASSSGARLMRQARAHIGPDAELGLVAWREQHLLQAEGPVREFGFARAAADQWADAVAWLAQSPRDRWLFAERGAASSCVRPQALVGLGRSSRRDWVLVPASALVPGCQPPQTGALP